MRMLSLLAAIGLLTAAPADAANPCTNGSFEQLDDDGFPVDWGAVGQTVEVSDDAHSGSRSLRMLRTVGTESRETGLNRAWQPDSGERGAMVDRLKGGIDFWYKAVSAADDATLRIYAIAMTKDPIEKTGARRATFTVPAQHVGDGEWHHARLKYDFTDNEKARWVHFSARIVGTAGELLLDDVSYVERVGAILRLGKVRLDEDPDRPGRRCTLHVEVENAGDEVVDGIRATLTLPEGLTASPAQVALGALPPDETQWAAWTVVGARAAACSFGFAAAAGEAEAMATFAIEPLLEVESFGPVSPVATVGERIAFECVLRNPSSVIVRHATAEFRFPTSKIVRTAREVRPGQKVALRATLRPAHQTPVLEAAVRVTAGNGEKEATLATSLVVGANTRLPRPSGTLRTESNAGYALLENAHHMTAEISDHDFQINAAV